MRPGIYHLHPLVAGPLNTWPATFARVAAMGFSQVCLAPPFAPGANGDIFLHATFDRLHPALRFDGSAEAGLALAVRQADAHGLKLLLDIAPGQIAIDAPVRSRQPEWFATADGAAPDPRRPPGPPDVAVPRFDQTALSDAISDWWIQQLGRLLTTGIAGFRCLTLDHVPGSFWRRVIAAGRAASSNALVYLAWTPGVAWEMLPGLAGVGFDLTCSSAAWWDGRAAWLLDEHEALRQVAPSLASVEPSFRERLAARLPPDADLATAYRLSLGVAAATGDGLFMPMGFEYATARRFDAIRAEPADMTAARDEAPVDLSADISAANRMAGELPRAALIRPITAPGASVTAWIRTSAADIRDAVVASLVVINPDTVRPRAMPIELAPLPPSAGAAFSVRETAAADQALRPGEVRVLACCRTTDIIGGSGLELDRSWAESSRLAIEAVEPVVQGGDFPAKTVVGQELTVRADIIGDGHDILAAAVLWRAAGETTWQRVPMRLVANDRWAASVVPDRIGLYQFAVEAWWDQWATFTHDLNAKVAAGQVVDLEIQEGRQLVEQASRREGCTIIDRLGRSTDPAEQVAALLSDDMTVAMRAADDRPFATRSAVRTVRADRPAACFASWYELFPRSVTHDPKVHGTFRGVIERLPAIRAMGFDVLYFPPINPIGTVNRKGRNNSLRAEADDVGSPYAIGGVEGGHDAVHPALGSLDDFRAMLLAARANGLEIALDFAIQCAPDHPWVSQHKDWFRWRPDGSMRYAENPPKKYEDIVNPDFFGEASFPAVWLALRDVIQFWIDQGVRIFRVDNPHTKPLPFWHWMIGDIQGRHPDVLFLAEAFTRPKLMYRLAKVGFSQSYTYFTWRNTKQELTEYLTELTTPPVADFFRPNFFVNTPDINPIFLQTAGRPGFLIRAALAATLSGLWGVYSGFEICEAAPLPGREEYLDSEKYEIRPRDYAAAGNIVPEITALNRLRRLYPALQSHLGLSFQTAYNEQILLYLKGDILIAVSLDPHNVQAATIEIPLWEFGLPDGAGIAVEDLMRGDTFIWYGKTQRIQLDPAELPFRIWRLTLV
ncbi:maltotransferase domain-containing protein [Rhodopila sp.]|uniref:maltotransferase domain-containing protein n=1 Tax=Rhodopila sp. TaxID=2480087 RepID=UPI003D12D405